MSKVNKKRLILSGSVIAVAAIAVIGATGAFLSDSETSQGNVFTAGALDLQVDNDSYYNGNHCENVGTDESPIWEWVGDADYPVPGTTCTTSWNLDDLDEGHLFFNFQDLKPEDEGEDTISLHVQNDAWACMDLTLTSNDDNSSTEPELGDGDDEDVPEDEWDGELAQNIDMVWWADDGDNVLEEGENLLTDGVQTLYDLATSTSFSVALADAQNNAWGEEPGTPLPAEETVYIAKAWCFGDMTLQALPQGQGDNPSVASGVLCDGANLDNTTQTDSATLDVQFYTEQARHNEEFLCEPDDGPRAGTLIVTKILDNGDGTGSADSTDDFSFTIDGGGPIQFEADGTNEVEVLGGLHVVAEVPAAGYTTTISGPDCDAAGNVNVPAGGVASCTITNDDIPNQTFITVTKVVNNDDGGNKVIGDFALKVDGFSVTSGVATTTSAGAHTVSESAVFGYSATFSGDCNASGIVNVPAGGSASCTITNNDIRPVLTLVKNVVGGNADPDDFDLSINGAIVSSGSSNLVQANQAHEIDEEVLVAGYSFTSITGPAECPVSLPGDVTLTPGQSITCTITNTFTPSP